MPTNENRASLKSPVDIPFRYSQGINCSMLLVLRRYAGKIAELKATRFAGSQWLYLVRGTLAQLLIIAQVLLYLIKMNIPTQNTKKNAEYGSDYCCYSLALECLRFHRKSNEYIYWKVNCTETLTLMHKFSTFPKKQDIGNLDCFFYWKFYKII